MLVYTDVLLEVGNSGMRVIYVWLLLWANESSKAMNLRDNLLKSANTVQCQWMQRRF